MIYRTTNIGKSHLQNMGVNHSGMRRHVDFSLPEEAFELPTDLINPPTTQF